MVLVSTTKVSSKGQVLIPKKMRNKFKEGCDIFIIEKDNELILRNLKDLEEDIKEELEFNLRTNEARERIENGQFKEMDFDDFVNHLRKL
jgi:AbrB family looped-hinge helix DNA binding protein